MPERLVFHPGIVTAGVLVTVGLAWAWRVVLLRLAAARAEGRRLRRQLEAALTVSADATAFYDTDSKVVLANAAATGGHLFAQGEAAPAALALYDTNGVALRPEDWPLARVLRGETFHGYEVRVRSTTTAGERHLAYTGRPIVDDSGRQELALLTASDRTAGRRAKAALRQHQFVQTIGLLTAGITHDFNNVLTIVLGNAELLSRTLPSDSAARPDVDDILRAARKGAMMTRRLLRLVRRGPLTRSTVRPGDILLRLDPILRRFLPSSFALETEDATGPADFVHADTRWLEHLYVSLVAVCQGLLVTGGTVRVSCEPAWIDEHGRMTAVETGGQAAIVIATEADPQPPSPTTTAAGDHRLSSTVDAQDDVGLALVADLARELGGNLVVDVGRGGASTIRVLLPQVGPQTTDAEASPRPSTQLRGTETILVADNDDVIARMTRRALESAGYEVLVAHDGRAALELFQAHQSRIRLLVLDLVMPRMSGRQVAEAIRRSGREVPVLLVSAYAEFGDDGAPSASGWQILPKPWSLGNLLGSVRRLLDASPGPAAAGAPQPVT